MIGSESTGTGICPLWYAASAVATFVLALTRISEPGSRSSAATASWSAVVPLVTATPCCCADVLGELALEASISTPKEPEISPRRMALATASTSSSLMLGSKTGITTSP